MANNTRNKVVSSLAWTYFERFTAQIVSLIVTIILARILTPTEYGMIAIVTIFTEISNVIVVNGFGTALVQKEKPNSKDYSSVFYAGLVITFGLYGLLCIIAPYIAEFYEMPSLTLVLRVLGLQMPIAGINSVQQSYISKKMEFRKFFYATLGGTVVSAVVGITLAYLGFGVWALVAQLLTNRMIDTTVLFLTSGWKLTYEFSWSAFTKLFSYSWKITVSSLLITLYDNIRGLIVGKKYSADDLAYYNKGRQFPNLISVNINNSISKVLFPVLSNEHKNPQAVLSIYTSCYQGKLIFIDTVAFWTCWVARSFVIIVLTKKWLPIVPFLEVICVVYTLQPLQTASIQAMKAIGRSDTCLKLEIIKKIINFAILLTTLFAFNSVLIVAIGALLAEIISTAINFPANKKLINYSIIDQIKDITPALALSTVMFIAVYICGTCISTPLIALIIQILIGGMIYILLSIVLKIESFSYTKKMLIGIFIRRSNHVTTCKTLHCSGD